MLNEKVVEDFHQASNFSFLLPYTNHVRMKIHILCCHAQACLPYQRRLVHISMYFYMPAVSYVQSIDVSCHAYMQYNKCQLNHEYQIPEAELYTGCCYSVLALQGENQNKIAGFLMSSHLQQWQGEGK
ncbi:hypothetical protein ACH5RR_020763 [Cinchona calisaya]|uniref:Uncharacterized protein n=1 Tax=Cinchona calisaya TaxID=153742 RepID=A0ABD2ZFD4_9GENT